MSTDALERAKHLLDVITQASPAGYFKGGEKLPKEWVVTLIQLNTQIALAEEVRTLNATLHDATDLNGAIKLAGDDHLEEIRNHLDDVGSVLLNARGPDGAIKVTQ